MRGGVKRAVERALVHSGLAGLVSLRRREQGLILAYHNVVPDGESPWGERSLHVSAARFRTHLQVLAEAAEIVPLKALLEEPHRPTRKPQVAITFDDGYRGAATAGSDELRRLGVPATFFLSPGLTSEEGFWWDRLAHDLDGVLAADLRSHCLGPLKGRQTEVLMWARDEGVATPASPEFARPASDKELVALIRSGAFDVQCHTWSHPNLVQLSSSERREEFRRVSEWFRRHAGRLPELVSYPYGLESPGVHTDAQSSRYRWGLRVSGGWLPREGLNPFALPRLNVPSGLSPEGLRLRLAGIGVG